MGHKSEISSRTVATKPTPVNLQTRPFATPDVQEEEVSQKQSDATSGSLKFSENLLEKQISTPTSESAIPVQRKPENRLKAISAQKIAIQTKLNIGEPNDKYEKDADDTAAKVVQQINSPANPPVNSSSTSPVQNQSVQNQPVQRQEAVEEEKGEEEQEEVKELITNPDPPPIQRQGMSRNRLRMKSLVQRRENISGGEASTDLESSIQSARGKGQSLEPNLQAKMGQAMGADFSGVKVHTDSQSDQLNKSIQAKAFTTGQDVFFRQGTYDPSSRGGQELIAHELTHVVQQDQTKIRRDTQPQQGSSDIDKLYEEAAVAQKELYPLVTSVASKTNGKPKLLDSLKGRERATQKIATDYGGDASRLVDIARASIVYTSFANVMDGLAQCTQSMNVVREKNRFVEATPAGYRDILLNVKLSNGHIAELQLHLEQILDVKSGVGHKLYEEIRTLQAEAEKAKRGLTAEEQAKVDQLLKESKEHYDAAFAESLENEPSST
jgi:hypothetical protein